MNADTKLLIDSHVFIWMLYRPQRLSQDVIQILEQATLYISYVSLWELALKHGKGKLAYPPADLLRGTQELGIERLPIRDAHLLTLGKVKLPHGNPFDQLLVAQSESEGYSLVTADRLLLNSPYQTIAA